MFGIIVATEIMQKTAAGNLQQWSIASSLPTLLHAVRTSGGVSAMMPSHLW